MVTLSSSRRQSLTDPFWIDDWCVQTSSNRLSRNGATVKLEPKAMAVLVYLAERAGEAVARERLEQHVWQGRVVGYDTLNITISKLRRALDDDSKHPRVIETIPKVGYRLIGKVSHQAPTMVSSDTLIESPLVHEKSSYPARRPYHLHYLGAGATVLILALSAVVFWTQPRDGAIDASNAPAPALPEKPSIVVLPFDNLSEGVEHEYFSDGITDDLITDLAKISGLTVIARNSAFTYKDKPINIREITRRLDVRYVLEGSVRNAEGKVRINARLLDSTTGRHLWADRYDGPLADVFTLQDDVTSRIVAALKIRLTPQEARRTANRGTDDISAYDAFLRGWAHLLRKTPEDAVHAISAFEQALKSDPNYARAYAALAQTYWDNSIDPVFNMLVGPPMSASTHVGYTGFISAWRYLSKARDAPSSQAMALTARMLQRQRRFEEAMETARQAVALGPNDPVAFDVLIENLIYSGKAEEAMELIDESIRLDPHLPGEKLFLRGLAYFTMGRLDDALSFIVRARNHNPRQSRYAAIHAAVLADLDRVEEAEAALEQYLAGWTTFTTLDWVMFYWPFEDAESAERLANGLVKAGLSLSPRRYYRIDAGNRLRGQQIEALLKNNTIVAEDKSFYGGDNFRVTRDRDMQIVDQDFLTYFGEGRSRVQDDLLCDPWRSFGDYCVAIYRNASGSSATLDEYVFFTLMNIFVFSVVD